MMYRWREWQLVSMEPFRLAAGLTHALITDAFAGAGRDAQHATTTADPFAPFATFARATAAGCELFERLTRRWERPEWGIASTAIEGRELPVRTEVAWERPFCTLTHFLRVGDTDRHCPRLLIVAPMSGHFATLLRDTVAALIPDHDVYVTEWANARDVPVSAGSFDLDDYVEYVREMLRFLGPGTHVVGVCQPVVPVLAAVSTLAEDDDLAQPLSMTLIAGPIDARVNPTAVNEYATAHPLPWFEQWAVTQVPFPYAGAGRAVYPGFMQLGAFLAMHPDRHFQAQAGFASDLIDGNLDRAEHHREFYDEYFSVMDMTAEYYLQTIDEVFHRFALARGEMTWRGRHVDPSRIRHTALMTIEGERDDITGLGQTEAAHALCTAVPDDRREHYVQADVGHFGVFSGHHWREETMPRLRAFIRRHDRP